MAVQRPRVRTIALVPALTLLLLAEPVASAKAPTMALTRGKAVFWSGEPDAPTCGDGCWEYQLDVRDRGGQLRFGIDHVVVGDVFNVEVTTPAGTPAGSFSPGSGLYSAELFVPSPEKGRWSLRVTAASDVQDPRFRMRALLEKPPRFPKKRVAMLPNLQVAPPYDFHFEFPVTDGGFRGLDGRPIGAPAPAGPTSCHPEEVADGAVRCLRMAFGVGNAGLGPMELRYENAGATQTEDQTLYQRIYYSDGSTRNRDTGGIARYHPSHAHYHHDQAVSLQLFRVTDPKKGTLEPIGAELRKGFHHREEWLRPWDYFYPIWGWSPPGNGFGLGPGWGDYYEWDRPANYIDFGLEGDGEYVVRATADPIEGVLESNEDDNVGYTYFRVSGLTVEALESGHGADPWDPCKIVLPIGTEPEPSAKQPRRSPTCPPDTTRP